jgi:hypothetical protein
MLNRKILRKFGFKTDQEGIINRYFREEGGWNEHLKKTKKYILQVADNKQKGSVVILGSGWLLDVPLQELSDQFDKVVLVDVVHPRQIEHKVKKMPNVKLLSEDVTGLVTPVFERLKSKKPPKIPLSEIKPDYDHQLISELKKASLVVSVNLLNQLDILICDYIDKFKLYNKEEINSFRKLIQTNHLQLLPADKSALITDYEELNLDKNDKVINRRKLVHISIPNEKEAAKWKWSFDLKKTYHADSKTIFKVVAVEI